MVESLHGTIFKTRFRLAFSHKPPCHGVPKLLIVAIGKLVKADVEEILFVPRKKSIRQKHAVELGIADEIIASPTSGSPEDES